MKLTSAKVLEIIRRKNEGYTTYQARKIGDISIRRVNQIYEFYLKTGKPPALGRRMGRPNRLITDEEIKLIEKAYGIYRVSASTLEPLIMRDYSISIPHNQIHKVLLELNLAKKKEKIDVRKKHWKRYERKHSLTAIHLDWYYDPQKEQWVLPVIDDASRKMLSLIEEKTETAEASARAVELALKHGKIEQCITDHGSTFYNNIYDAKNEKTKNIFEKYLEKQGIKHILCRVKHPQSNGKSEKFNDLYKNHRHAFETKEEFMKWYNEIRPHMSLNFEILETPEQAFQRKIRKED